MVLLLLLCGNSVGSGSYSFRHAHVMGQWLISCIGSCFSTSFFGAIGYPPSFVEECIVKWIIRNCPSPILPIISKKNCKSSESYKASIIFYLKAFQKKCNKARWLNFNNLYDFVPFGPWFSINFRTFPCGPGSLESLRNASMTLMGYEAFHVATEVHFAVDLGLLVLHVAHLKPDPIKSPPEMQNQEMIRPAREEGCNQNVV